MVVQLLVHRRGPDRHVGVRGAQRLGARARGEQADEAQVGNARALQPVDRGDQLQPLRVERQDAPLVQQPESVGRLALGGEPGVISARWGGIDYTVKNQLILDRLAGLAAAKRGCGYVTVLAIAMPDGRMFQRTGRCRGLVAEAPAGTGGFGYDPIFFYPELGKTMAQMDGAEKDQISHRGRAARALAIQLLIAEEEARPRGPMSDPFKRRRRR